MQHKKRSRSPDPELIPLTTREEEEALLTERPTADGPRWNERDLERGPSTPDAQQQPLDDFGEVKAMNHETKRSQLPRIFSSPSLSPDDCAHSLSLSTRSLSRKPMRQRWSPMRQLELSALVMAFAAVAVLALAFTLHYSAIGSQKNRDALHHSDTGENISSGGMNAITRGHGAAFLSRNRRDLPGSRTAVPPEEGGASSASTYRGSGKRRPIAFGSPRIASRSPVQEGVVLWNEEGFGSGRPRNAPYRGLGFASK